ncbi:hypothetical protein [Agrilutibacter solisilvae]|uniref:Uncharacterized protein n=1 Tax=Agrilutibacter solisilvae TaxID=2763317 RepID=A0A974Y009_9GAMM|nr:hypothetical protein [Lysobacter solisilvae]QSX78902.1 hypothetical protein I8J32_002965 [Lysobacter solisilvae]
MHVHIRSLLLVGLAAVAAAGIWKIAQASPEKGEVVKSAATQAVAAKGTVGAAAAPASPYAPPATGVPDGFRGFDGSYAYPTTTPPPPAGGYPWTQSLNGQPITPQTAGQYVELLKQYITDDMVTLLSDPRTTSQPSTWDPAKLGWFNQPWLSPIRDGIHGAYTGSTCFSPVLFPKSGLTQPFTTYVLVFYNDVAARSLQRVWGSASLAPDLSNNASQFDEGSIVVKAAFSTADASTWPPMKGALPWTIYLPTFDCASQTQAGTPSQFQVSFFQFDIIVKDTKAAPKTGWVFSTLTFDNAVKAPGGTPASDAWAQMVPLGAMWGNDPQATKAGDTLNENWINPAAPVYATETLGWGGRLSGPNDGAVQNPPYYTCTGAGCNPKTICKDPTTCKLVDVGGPNMAMSSCMSCHGVSQYAMASFLLPTPLAKINATGQPVPGNVQGNLVFFQEGSDDWMRWFQSRPGTQPQDPANRQVLAATDYAMNFPFKSLQYWAKEICINQGNPDKAPACSALANPTKALLMQELREAEETNYQGKKLRMR